MTIIVEAKANEVALLKRVYNKHTFLICFFYRSTKQRYKITLKQKAFPSDHYAVEFQIRLCGLDAATAMICMKRREVEY